MVDDIEYRSEQHMTNNDELREYVREQPLDLACSIIVTEFRQYLTRIRSIMIGIEAGVSESSGGLERIKEQLTGINETINDIMLGELLPRLRELNPNRSDEAE